METKTQNPSQLGKYPIRVLITRNSDTSRKYLDLIEKADPSIKVHRPAILVEGVENSAFHLCAERGNLKIFVINTERGPYHNHPNVIYSMIKHFNQNGSAPMGIMLYITGETLGIVKPSRFHNFPSITIATDADAEAYFTSGLIGHTAKEIEASLAQSLQYLLSLETRETRETPVRAPRGPKKTPGAPKKPRAPKKTTKKTKPRKLSYEDNEDDSRDDRPSPQAPQGSYGPPTPWANLGN